MMIAREIADSESHQWVKLINWWDFEFDKIEATARSTSGVPYQRGVSVGMPRIPPQVLNSPFYLYHTAADAKSGGRFGGTGFFVGVPIPDRPTSSFMYAVTNWHVAVRAGASVIRVNKVGGGVDIFEFDPSEWSFQPGGYDLAVIPINAAMKGTHDIVPLSTDIFVDRTKITDWGIGAGEDVFMIGRFVDHDGAASNVPAARFGHISTMPQQIAQPTGARNLESFILDLHSRTGYSGSPVFVYRTYGADLTHAALVVGGAANHFIQLLGIHWGQFPEQWEIEAGTKPAMQSVELSGDARYVKGMSGMTLAIPAWAIMEMLNMPKFRQAREQALREGSARSAPVAESEPPTKEDNPLPAPPDSEKEGGK